MSRPGGALLLFAREPVIGQVKTRLVPEIGPDRALSLYRVLLEQQIALVNAQQGVARQCWIDGDLEHADFRSFEGSRHSQVEGDLGRRMGAAMDDALLNHDFAVLIGCDCPQLDTAYLESAFKVLEEGADAVFGPAADGGYVLIGLRQSEPGLFREIDWGTGWVMAQTRSKLARQGLQWQELSTVSDIDTPADLALLGPSIMKRWVQLDAQSRPSEPE